MTPEELQCSCGAVSLCGDPERVCPFCASEPAVDTEAAARFMARVDKSGGGTPHGCWLWGGARSRGTNAEYGQFYDRARARMVYAHRWAYEYFVGPIPDGAQIDHVAARGCVHTLCVNPDHLEAVTPQVNTLRGCGPTAQNSKATHCKHGHELTGDNVTREPGRPERRKCRACHARRLRDARAAHGKAVSK